MTFLNVDEIESALVALHSTYPALTELLPLPNVTYEGRKSNALLISSNPRVISRSPRFTCRPAFVFVSGVHAREWGGPDILVNLAADLLEAYTTNSGLAYGKKSFSVGQVKAIVARCDIVVFPDINPDGRAYSMAGGSQAMWRKNRNPASSGGVASKIGVDANRNYDFLWDFPVKFASGLPAAPASTDPANDTFRGTGPFSEPEARNVQWLVDHFPNARYFVDIHSYTGDVLYPWGDDENQTTDPSKSFMNPDWDGKRGRVGDAYREYLPAWRLAELQSGATAMRDGIFAVRGQSYVTSQGFFLLGYYPTSGASDDWAFSREFLDPNERRLDGYAIEFNKNQDFFPTWAEMENLIKDVDAGLISLCSHARPSLLQVILCRIGQRRRPIRVRFRRPDRLEDEDDRVPGMDDAPVLIPPWERTPIGRLRPPPPPPPPHPPIPVAFLAGALTSLLAVAALRLWARWKSSRPGASDTMPLGR
jgi:murein tripeptide amidase MpaA